ncbi:hypothetical protein AAG570_002852 [Ranatra chinensis]|uniref:Translation initiation factor eIF2B subunit epsilon n=1 Tax=Ranatra chinensis TaxID=642074 RepID=A0ABD0Y517_9HEMI
MHADEIKKFVRNGCWGRMTITVVISEGCRSLGDAMRDLDAKSIIRGDFILLTGNVVGNIQLLNALDRHKRYQLNDKGTAMTLIYKECGKKRKNRQNDVYLVVDAASSRLLYYDKNPDSRQKLNVPLEILLERDEVDIRSDLLDTGVCICSVSVPPLFSDNFDFQTKDDFVRGLLMNDEILESSVYCHLTAQGEYAASVTNWNDYHFISHDIIHRWTYPQVPDTCYDELYSYRRNNVYIQEGISLATGCSIVEDVVIGSGTTVGEKAIVSSSVIGKNCDIAENAIVQYSYLFNNVKIGSNCKIQYCVLGEGCIVETGSSVIHSILGPGVVVETESNVCATRLQSTPPEIGDDKETKRGDRAYVYRPDDEFESDSDSEVMELQNRNDWIGLVDNSVKEEDESSDSDGETDNDQMSNEVFLVFHSEVIDSLIRGYEDDILVQNLVLEVNSSRYAYNMTLSEVNYYVTRAVLSLADKELATNQNRWQTTDKLITYFLPLLKNYVRNSLAMMDCLNAIEVRK